MNEQGCMHIIEFGTAKRCGAPRVEKTMFCPEHPESTALPQIWGPDGMRPPEVPPAIREPA